MRCCSPRKVERFDGFLGQADNALWWKHSRLRVRGKAASKPGKVRKRLGAVLR